eukprot:GEMP01056952.1.p1 GENE.GEMP01056952.1~~GEMP01056952.1.p1  ORF type:complete len:115 (+),score=34.03 GEMP01056952.1:188-532(+)
MKPIDHAPHSYVPALFVAAHDDTFVHPRHARKLYDAYAGDKNFVIIEGTHGSLRPRYFLDSVAMFFTRALHHDKLLQLSRDACFFDESGGGQRYGEINPDYWEEHDDKTKKEDE